MYINQKLLNAICECRKNKVQSFTLPQSDIEVILYPDQKCLRIIEGDKVQTLYVSGDIDLVQTLMTMKWDEICNLVAGDRDGFDLDVNRYLVSALYDSIASELNMPEAQTQWMKHVLTHVSATNAADFMRLCANAIITNVPEMTSHVAEIVDVHMGYSEATKRTASIIAEVGKKLREDSDTDIEYSDVVVADFYAKTNNAKNNNPYYNAINMLYAMLYNTGLLQKISFEYKEYDEYVYFACYKTDLINIAQSIDIPEIALAIEVVNKTSRCNYTSAIQPSYNMVTYRDVCGCITKVRETWYTQQLINEACYVLFNELHSNGNRCCIELLFKLMSFK